MSGFKGLSQQRTLLFGIPSSFVLIVHSLCPLIQRALASPTFIRFQVWVWLNYLWWWLVRSVWLSVTGLGWWSSYDSTASRHSIKTGQTGFGSLQTDLWLGLEAMHQITTKQPHKARFHMIADDGTAYMAEYSSFKVDDEATNYRLSVSGHSGNASDDITALGKTYQINNGQSFTTRDRDNDGRSDANCAVKYHSAWWHKSCSSVHINTPCKKQVGYKCPTSCLLWHSVTTTNGSPLNYTRIEIMPNT